MAQACEKGSRCVAGSAVLGALCVPLRFALGGLFLFAAYNKLFIKNGPQLFSESVKAFKVFDPKSQEQMIQLATFVTPWIEVVAGVALVIGLWTRAAAGVLASLLLVFIALIAYVLLQPGEAPECGCFGKMSPFCPTKLSSCNIVQNGVLLAMAAVIMASRRPVLAVDQFFRKS